jgi:hypothetical protein
VVSFLVLMRRFGRAFRAVIHDPETRALPLLTLVILLTGTLFYSRAEDWSLVDALYFSVTTLTTVGIGDFAPTSTASKLFTVLYLMVGLGVLLAFATAIGRHVVKQRRHFPRVEARPERDREPRGGAEGAAAD